MKLFSRRALVRLLIVLILTDGSARFIDETIEPIAMRTLVTRGENDISSWSP